MCALYQVERLLPHPHDRHYRNLCQAIRLANERAAVLQKGDYRTGEFVWAKLEGFPWWPAEIAQTSPLTPARPGQRLVSLFVIKEASWFDINDLKPFDREDKEAMAVGRHDTVLIKAIGIMKAEHDAKKEAGTLRVYTPGAEEGTDTGLCADADVPITVGELNDEQAF